MNTSHTVDLTNVATQALEEHLAHEIQLELWLDNAQHGDHESAMRCHILQLTQENFTIAFDDHQETNLNDGQTIQLTTCGSTHQVQFSSNVLGKIEHPDFQNVYMLSNPYDIQGLGIAETRLSFRFSTTNLNLPPFKLTPKPPHQQDNEQQWENDHIISLHCIESEIQNASEGGLGVAVPIFVEAMLAKTKRIKGTIELPGDNEPFQINARIAHYHYNKNTHNYYLGLEVEQDQLGRAFLGNFLNCTKTQFNKQPTSFQHQLDPN